jgi:hypothetical protein
VLPAGIEPAFLPSEGSVLSIERRERSTHSTKWVLSVGIEPTLPAPQASVLSIERRERTF